MERFVLIAVIVTTLASLKECPTCTKALVSSNLEDNQNLLCFFKVYNSEETNFGGLNAPSPFYLEYVKQLQDAFVTDFSIYTKSGLAGKKLLSKLQTIPVPFQSCPDFPLELFIYKLEFIMV